MKLLFIGNSHTYYNSLPATVKHLLEQTGTRTHVTMVTRGGKSLAFHAENETTLFNIRHGEYDLVILQDRASDFDTASFTAGAEALLKEARAAGSSVMLYMPWALRDNREAQEEMTNAYLALSRRLGVPVAAAGEVFGRLLNRYPADLLYCKDGNHATPLGSYAAALTVFYTLTGRKRVLSLDKLEDPGVAAGFPAELCRLCHTEACYIARLLNA